MTGLLKDKVAVVTGGASGIGLSTVERFVGAGGKVVIADIDDAAGHAISERLGEATAYAHADVTDEQEIEALIAGTVERFGRLDVMVNNAGAGGDPSAIIDLGADGFDRTLALLARSVLLGHKYAARQFRSQGTGGSIISTASIAGMQGGWSPVGYTTAKHAVVGIVRQAAAELGPSGIRSNAIAPSSALTGIQARAFGVAPERTEEFNRFLVERLGPKQAMGRFGTSEDVANTALFLASDLSGYINGAVIPVDGGATTVAQSSSVQELVDAGLEFLRR